MFPYCPGGPMSCQSAPGCAAYQSCLISAHQCCLLVPISADYQYP
ncbi:unnamed protein product, partial [Staurois parvus]